MVAAFLAWLAVLGVSASVCTTGISTGTIPHGRTARTARTERTAEAACEEPWEAWEEDAWEAWEEAWEEETGETRQWPR
jgi:hypothetical protein